MIRGKLNHYTKKDILKIEPDFVFDETNVLELHDILEEDMLNKGFVLYDNEITFDKEIVVNGYHELRFSCMVIKGVRRKGKFILKECLMQYRHIK